MISGQIVRITNERITDLGIETAPSFGTSGLRGLVTTLSRDCVMAYVKAFLASCPHGDTLFTGYDLRPSSPDIAAYVREAALAWGIDVIECGVVPTPALAERSISAGAAAVMITGSHLASDRNGLKFYVPAGEITKSDEGAILAALHVGQAASVRQGHVLSDNTVAKAFGERYLSAFPVGALAGMTIGVYEHSSAARDIIKDVLSGLGAKVHPLLRSDHFIPVDTEALDNEVLSELAEISQDLALDAIVSTDGDGDRPMMLDHLGHVVPGDVLGVLAARHLGANVVCTPVSSNDMVQQIPEFTTVQLTKIGSPHVIAAMEALQASRTSCHVVGFEANGGFLLGFDAQVPGAISALMTRDSLLPIIAVLAAAKAAGQAVATFRDALPACYTAAGRVQNIDPTKAKSFLDNLIASPTDRANFFQTQGAVRDVDLTDGLRVNFVSGQVIHLRPSGNAPEFRLYVQASEQASANQILSRYIKDVAVCVI